MAKIGKNFTELKPPTAIVIFRMIVRHLPTESACRLICTSSTSNSFHISIPMRFLAALTCNFMSWQRGSLYTMDILLYLRSDGCQKIKKHTPI